MFGSCFLKLILTVVFENNILGPICLHFLKTIFFSKKEEQGKHKNTFGSKISIRIFLLSSVLTVSKLCSQEGGG